MEPSAFAPAFDARLLDEETSELSPETNPLLNYIIGESSPETNPLLNYIIGESSPETSPLLEGIIGDLSPETSPSGNCSQLEDVFEIEGCSILGLAQDEGSQVYELAFGDSPIPELDSSFVQDFYYEDRCFNHNALGSVSPDAVQSAPLEPSSTFSDEPQETVASNDDNTAEKLLNNSKLIGGFEENQPSLNAASLDEESLNSRKRKCSLSSEEEESISKRSKLNITDASVDTQSLLGHRSVSDSSASVPTAVSPQRPRPVSVQGLGFGRKCIQMSASREHYYASDDQTDCQTEDEDSFVGFAARRTPRCISEFGSLLTPREEKTLHHSDDSPLLEVHSTVLQESVSEELPSKTANLQDIEHNLLGDAGWDSIYNTELAPAIGSSKDDMRKKSSLFDSSDEGSPVKSKQTCRSDGSNARTSPPVRLSSKVSPTPIASSIVEVDPSTTVKRLPTPSPGEYILPEVCNTEAIGGNVQFHARDGVLDKQSGEFIPISNDPEIQFIDEVPSKVKSGPAKMKSPFVKQIVTKQNPTVNIIVQVNSLEAVNTTSLQQIVTSINSINSDVQNSARNKSSASCSPEAVVEELNACLNAPCLNNVQESIKIENKEPEIINLCSDDEAESEITSSMQNLPVIPKVKNTMEMMPRIVKTEIMTPVHPSSSNGNNNEQRSEVKKMPYMEYIKKKNGGAVATTGAKKFTQVKSSKPGVITFSPMDVSSMLSEGVPSYNKSPKLEVFSASNSPNGKVFTLVKSNVSNKESPRIVQNAQFQIKSIKEEFPMFASPSSTSTSPTSTGSYEPLTVPQGRMLAVSTDRMGTFDRKRRKKLSNNANYFPSSVGNSAESSDYSCTDSCSEDEVGDRSHLLRRRKSRSKLKRGIKGYRKQGDETLNENGGYSSSDDEKLSKFEQKRLSERRVRQRSRSFSPDSLYQVGCVCNKGSSRKIGHSKLCKFYKTSHASSLMCNVDDYNNKYRKNHLDHRNRMPESHLNRYSGSYYDAPGYSNQSQIGQAKTYYGQLPTIKSEHPPNQMQSYKFIENRQVVYIGGIDKTTSKDYLKGRFEQFGTIKLVQIHPREKQDSYAFITFSSTEEAAEAIAHGNDGHANRLEIHYGGRRQFCGQEYVDLDAARDVSPVPVTPKVEVSDYDALLAEMRNRKA